MQFLILLAQKLIILCFNRIYKIKEKVLTIIRPISAQDILLKEKIQEAASDLNLSEILAVNEKFGTNLEYTPIKDCVEITITANKKSASKMDEFSETCEYFADEFAKKFNKGKTTKIIPSSKSAFKYNLDSAIKKLKNTLKF